MDERKRLIICGAAGRDYHNFNQVYRDDPAVEVVAFSAIQIPDVARADCTLELSLCPVSAFI